MAKKDTIVRYDVDRLKIEQTDVETVSSNTDESLLNTRSNSESNSISKGSSSDSCYDKKKRKNGKQNRFALSFMTFRLELNLLNTILILINNT